MVIETRSSTSAKKPTGSVAVGSTSVAKMDEIKEADESAKASEEFSIMQSIDDIGYQIGGLGDQVVGVGEKISGVGQSIERSQGNMMDEMARLERSMENMANQVAQQTQQRAAFMTYLQLANLVASQGRG